MAKTIVTPLNEQNGDRELLVDYLVEQMDVDNNAPNSGFTKTYMQSPEFKEVLSEYKEIYKEQAERQIAEEFVDNLTNFNVQFNDLTLEGVAALPPQAIDIFLRIDSLENADKAERALANVEGQLTKSTVIDMLPYLELSEADLVRAETYARSSYPDRNQEGFKDRLAVDELSHIETPIIDDGKTIADFVEVIDGLDEGLSVSK